MSSDFSEFHAAFFEESFDAIESMEQSLLILETDAADPDAINTIFRGAHSIKGGAGMLGFSELGQFTHVMETVLDQMRDGTQTVSTHVIDVLLRSVDVLRNMLTAQQQHAPLDPGSFKAVLEELVALEAGNSASENSEVTEPQPPEEPPAIEEPASVAQQYEYYFDLRPYPNFFSEGIDPARFFDALSELGALEVSTEVARVPKLEKMEPETCYLRWFIKLTTDAEPEQIKGLLDWLDGHCDYDFEHIPLENPRDNEPGSPPPAESTTEPSAAPASPQESAVVETIKESDAKDIATSKPSPTQATPRQSTEASSLRVGIDKVDALINLVGELVITQSMLSRFGDDFDMLEVEDLRKGLAQLMRNTRELQESVMRIRMLPIKFSFSRFPRMVRDLCGRLGKQVEVQLQGEQTELDKTVLDKLSDPLVHIVRNAIDHGIEDPDVRVAAGKSPTGLLRLNAYHAGGSIVIEVSDDGAGLDSQRILEKAQNKGLVSPGDSLTEEAIHNLIFAPGFSTAAEVNDLSGRGVGMDVVRRNINDLGGNVDIHSKQGQGSTITIRLPLTLAILDGQLVRVGTETYIIPLVSILESLQPIPQNVNTIAGGGEVYRMRDQEIPIVRLHRALSIEPDNHDISEGLIVVADVEGGPVGLLVDDLLAQQQIVIKSLEANFRQVPGLSGATILGDGTVALILDIPGLVQHHLKRSPAPIASAA